MFGGVVDHSGESVDKSFPGVPGGDKSNALIFDRKSCVLLP